MKRAYLALVLVLSAAPLAAQQKKEVVNLPGSPAPTATSNLSNAIKIGNMMWVSGLTGTTQGDTVGNIEKETTATLDKIKATLQAVPRERRYHPRCNSGRRHRFEALSARQPPRRE